MLKLKRFAFALLAVAVSFSSFAKKDDLLEVYFQALKHDPTFQSAFSSKLATEESYPQARALFLPLITGTLSHKQTYYTNDRYDTSSAQGNFTFVGSFRYHTKSYTLSLTQSLLNYGSWAKLEQANATVKQAVSTYNASLQNLIVRVTNAYLDVLQAQDTLRFTQAEKRANRRQLDQAQHRYKVGLDAITSVYDARASYDAVKAREIIARNEVDNAKEKLREITGYFHNDVAMLAHGLPLLSPEPHNVSEWVKTAKRRNFSLIAARHATEAAHANVHAQFAGHLPTLSLTGQWTDNRGGSAASGGSHIDTKIVGLQLDMPIFEGGLVNSETRQAQFQHDQSKADLEKMLRQVVSQTHQSYNSVLAGISTVMAGKQAVKSAQSSVDSTESAFKVGTRTMVNVLDAQKDLYDAERALAKSQYDYLRATINLKNAAGTLNVTDIEEINTWLDAIDAHTTLERFKQHGLYKAEKSRFTEVPMRKYHELKPKTKSQISKKK